MNEDTWNAELYDAKFGYVSSLAGGVTELLAPKPGETILDLGCGTGELAAHTRLRDGVWYVDYPRVRFAAVAAS